jgi:hypothetical protein
MTVLVSINDEEGCLVMRRYDSRLHYGLTHAMVIEPTVMLTECAVRAMRTMPADCDKVPWHNARLERTEWT